MIKVSKKLKYLFDFVSTPINEENVEMGKLIYSIEHKEEVKDIPFSDWNVIHINGKPNDCRSKNLELVIFSDN